MTETLGSAGPARTPAGCYPAHGEMRWWDGTQWTVHSTPLVTAVTPISGPTSPVSASGTTGPTIGAVTDETAPLYPYKDPSPGPSATGSTSPFPAHPAPSAPSPGLAPGSSSASSSTLYAPPGNPGGTPSGAQPVPYAGGYGAAQQVAYEAVHPVPYQPPYSPPYSVPYGAHPVVFTDARTNGAEVAIAWVVTVLTLGYMLPWAIAATRGKSNSWAVGLVNFLLGWTFIGWVVALVMSCTAHQVVSAR